MLTPTRHLDLNTCVLNVSAMILRQLGDHGPTGYNFLVMNLQDELGKEVRFQVGPALSLLYLMGLVEYDDGSDTLFRNPPARTGANR